jgi:hypothetical protein
MHDAWYFGIASLPDSAKAELDVFLKTCNVPQAYAQEFGRIADFMNGSASTDGFMTRMKIQDLDRKRNQDFAAVCPEMAALINYNKND